MLLVFLSMPSRSEKAKFKDNRHICILIYYSLNGKFEICRNGRSRFVTDFQYFKQNQ